MEILFNEEFREFAISCMTGSSGRQRAQANGIKEYDIRIPPHDVIDKLNTELPGFVKKLKNNSKQIRTLEKLRDTLLPKLMSGEVMVKLEQQEAGI
jgi:type I restriction enzyme S subunit